MLARGQKGKRTGDHSDLMRGRKDEEDDSLRFAKSKNVIDSEVGVQAKTSVVGDDTANQTNQPGGMRQQPESAQKKDEKAAAPNIVAPARIA